MRAIAPKKTMATRRETLGRSREYRGTTRSPYASCARLMPVPTPPAMTPYTPYTRTAHRALPHAHPSSHVRLVPLPAHPARPRCHLLTAQRLVPQHRKPSLGLVSVRHHRFPNLFNVGSSRASSPPVPRTAVEGSRHSGGGRGVAEEIDHVGSVNLALELDSPRTVHGGCLGQRPLAEPQSLLADAFFQRHFGKLLALVSDDGGSKVMRLPELELALYGDEGSKLPCLADKGHEGYAYLCLLGFSFARLEESKAQGPLGVRVPGSFG
mmetsp:Transcript_6920/g.16719  ORF Transcript_6920/g.16719 Transcript_6920/m.16719 type:complete len:267 (-) Transcript_6920:86-886(-)